MKKNIFYLFVITVILFAVGTAMHFGIEIFGRTGSTVIFFPTDESLFQHLKLGVYPLLAFYIALAVYKKIRKEALTNFALTAAVSIFVFMLFVISFYFTYTGIIGTNILILDIVSLFFGIFLGLFAGYQMTEQKPKPLFNWISTIFIFFVLFCLIYFTFYPPNTPLFQEYA